MFLSLSLSLLLLLLLSVYSFSLLHFSFVPFYETPTSSLLLPPLALYLSSSLHLSIYLYFFIYLSNCLFSISLSIDLTLTLFIFLYFSVVFLIPIPLSLLRSLPALFSLATLTSYLPRPSLFVSLYSPSSISLSLSFSIVFYNKNFSSVSSKKNTITRTRLTMLLFN